MSQPKSFSIAIIGGGIAGLTLAVALHERQIPVTVYEQASHFGEIGAGVSFGPNAVQAMTICSAGVKDAFLKVSTKNGWSSKKDVWFDVFNGYNMVGQESTPQEPEFQILVKGEHAGVYRAHFLDEVVKLVPKGIAKFGKRLDSITEIQENGKLVMMFFDGTVAEADAIIGCDGIKSRVRQIMLGHNHPSANPVYTHKYAYRGLIPMDKAVTVMGEERARNSCLHMGQGAHLLTFPVNHGKLVNVVAFCTNADNWTDYPQLTRPAKREDAIKDFQGFNSKVHTILKMINSDLDCWAIFDLGDHPIPTLHKDRVCILGDAAHATSPHQGAGAGLAIEDAAILSELLADDGVMSHKDLAAAFAAYDTSRRERAQWLIQGSRRNGDLVEWRTEDVGRDFNKIENEIKERCKTLWYVDVNKMVRDAKEELVRKLEIQRTVQ